MGKGAIISHLGQGQYEITLNLERARVEAELTDLTRQLAELDDLTPGPAVDLRRAVLAKRVQYLTANVAADPVVTAWCCDFSLELTGPVGTIEVPGERAGVPVLIRPGHLGAAAYAPARDGQLQPVLASTPAGAFYNLCMLPGWQKWRPTHRLGALTAKSDDTCSVALDPAASSDRGSGLAANLNINQDTEDGLVTLDNVPIEYMTCNGAAFAVGDRVVVEFTGQDWGSPKVIGFESGPRPCALGILAIALTGQRYDGAKPVGVGGPLPGERLIWDTYGQQPLAVPKAGGGYWANPVPAADYVGDWWADFRAAFNSGAEKSGLASRCVASSPEFAAGSGPEGFNPNHDFPPFIFQYYSGPASTGVLSDQHDFTGNNTQSSPPACPGFWSDNAAAAAGAAHNLGETWGDSLPTTVGSAVNAAGSVDSWSEEWSTTGLERYNWNFIIEESGCEEGEGGFFAYYENPGQADLADTGAGAFSFAAPLGVVPSAGWYLGFKQHAENLCPPPAISNTKILTANPGGRGIYGPAITWAGTMSYSSTYENVVVSGNDQTETVAFDHTMAGSGTFVFASGRAVAITATFAESGAVVSVSGSGSAFEWPAGYSFPKTVDYAISEVAFSQGYDPDDQLQLLIVLENQEDGQVETTSLPPPQPWSDGDYIAVESNPVVYAQTIAYELLTVRCDLVENAASDDPFALPENEPLTGALQTMITAFQAANPLPSGARWRLAPTVDIIKI
jgi:hypothetical protein